jgi:hypothetical protein
MEAPRKHTKYIYRDGFVQYALQHTQVLNTRTVIHFPSHNFQ